MKTILFSLLMLFSISTFSQNTDTVAIKNTIQKAYIDGILNKGDIAEIEKGFHPGFELLGQDRHDHLTRFPIYTWIDFVKKDKTNPAKDKKVLTAKFPLIDITKNAAIVKVEIYEDEKKLFTDYLSLYKFEVGWQIVAKIYHRHE